MKIVNDEMTRRVAVVTENDDISEAFTYMTLLEMHHVPVLRDGKLVGVLSDRDILLIAEGKGGNAKVPKMPVREVMTENVITCAPSSSIGRVAELMLEHKVHCLPVIHEDRRLVGIITSTDLIRVLRDREWRLEDPIPFRFQHPTPLHELKSC
jgi:CBS domain-containing protein